MTACTDHIRTSTCVAFYAIHLMAICGCAESPQKKQQEVSSASPVIEEQTYLDADEPIRTWKYIVIHHTATSSGSVESIDQEHSLRRDASGNPWRGIGYHFLIGNGNGMGDGEVQATFRWRDQLSGAHAGDRQFNNFGIGICLVGNFEENGPTPAQVKAVSELVSLLKYQLRITEEQILKHGDLKATACPGRLFPFRKIASIPPAGPQLVEGGKRSRFVPLESKHTEGIHNVAAIQRSRSKQRPSTKSQTDGAR